jgi:hypothetical protein
MLLVYACLAIAAKAVGALSSALFVWLEVRRATTTAPPAMQSLALLGHGVLGLLEECLFPAILLLCLMRLGVGRYSPVPFPGFQPVLPRSDETQTR